MTNIPPQAQLGQMITGYWTSQAIYAAAKFGIADLLGEGAKSVEELATDTGTRADFLYRLLRALASVGIFAEEDGQRFSLTPLAGPLRSGPLLRALADLIDVIILNDFNVHLLEQNQVGLQLVRLNDAFRDLLVNIAVGKIALGFGQLNQLGQFLLLLLATSRSAGLRLGLDCT